MKKMLKLQAKTQMSQMKGVATFLFYNKHVLDILADITIFIDYLNI